MFNAMLKTCLRHADTVSAMIVGMLVQGEWHDGRQT